MGRFYFFQNVAHANAQRPTIRTWHAAQRRRITGTIVAGMVGLCGAMSVAAQDLTFSATVDKTHINITETVTLTVTLSGDLEGVRLPALELPEAFVVAGQSQATSFALHSGTVERSVSASYTLIAREAGTFILGPFQLEHQSRMISTEPVEITVEKPAVPPSVTPKGGRFSI